MVIGEVGAGTGYFTLKLARAVGPGGRVYANDIDDDALEELQEKCQAEDLQNVITVVGDEDDPLLPVGSLELVIFVYSLHDIDEPVKILRNLTPSLLPGARVFILDQDPAATGSDHFLPEERVREIFRQAGYREVEADGSFLERDLLLAFVAAGHGGGGY
jgi:ubiquinone/menaquinone biosynthesis C-methylase UbiE